ncbi:hypothetical protein ABW41_09025 [Stenotrophomonas maltophilia]|nr:hypothetical protein ABW41_09025 [Stenotrophomonas maltophilia]
MLGLMIAAELSCVFFDSIQSDIITAARASIMTIPFRRYNQQTPRFSSTMQLATFPRRSLHSIAVSSNLTAHDLTPSKQTDTGMRSGTSGKQMTSVSLSTNS